MKKNGFTLIELLAVIVVLAIIAAITTAIIMNVVKDSKVSAFKSSVQGMMKATEIDSGVEGKVPRIYKVNNNELSLVSVKGEVLTTPKQIAMSGKVEGTGTISVDESGKTGVSISSGKYEAYKGFDNDLIVGEGIIPSLKNKILSGYKSTNTIGVLKDNDEYYYKGTRKEVGNNFVWYGGHLYRIVSYNEKNNTVKLVTEQPLTSISWHSHGNAFPFNESYINKWLNDETVGIFYKSLESNIKSQIVTSDFCTGLNIGDALDKATICNAKTNSKVGLLDTYEYNRAGEVNSYLNIVDFQWLGNTYDATQIITTGYVGSLEINSPNNSFGVRPVINVSANTIAEIGNGNMKSPYIAYNNTMIAANDSLKQAEVGDYIEIGKTDKTKTIVRIIEKKDNEFKVVTNDLIGASKFGDSILDNNSTNFPILTFLDNFYKLLPTNITDYQANISRDWNIGVYGGGDDYSAINEISSYHGQIGLLKVGEMLSGNDTDLANDLGNTIYGPSWYWLLNRYYNSLICGSRHLGNIDYYNPSYDDGGVRPTFYIPTTLIVVGGNGAPTNPYIVS